MTTITSDRRQDRTYLREGIRARRVWYHDIDVAPGLRTRFAEDYAANPVLKAVDEANEKLQGWMDRQLRIDLTGQRVLDLGCADGFFSIGAARRGAREVVGIERNRYNFRRAQWLAGQLGLDNLRYLSGSLEHHCAAFEPQSFDTVLCIALLYHLIDPLGTLHRIHRLCGRQLVLVTAIDLPEGDGSPMSRLDRYATGAHGLWSYNVPMVRQLLSTAGFDILDEDIEERRGGDRYAALAVPGSCSDHHIFEEWIDQPFPINIEYHRANVIASWKQLPDGAKVALFGAGTHTPWLLQQVAPLRNVEICCVLDDRFPPGGSVAGFPVRKPAELDPGSVDAVIISSWHQSAVIRKRARALYGDATRLISFD